MVRINNANRFNVNFHFPGKIRDLWKISDLSWTSFGVKVKLPLWKYDGTKLSAQKNAQFLIENITWRIGNN